MATLSKRLENLGLSISDVCKEYSKNGKFLFAHDEGESSIIQEKNCISSIEELIITIEKEKADILENTERIPIPYFNGIYFSV